MRKEVEHAEDMPSTSSDMFEPALCLSTSLTDLASQLDTTVLLPWLTEIAQDENIKFCLSDQVHAVPTYTVIVDSSLEFTTYVYNWPIPDDHKIYNDHKRSIKSVEDIRELLSTIETSKICEGVGEDCESRSAAIDPNADITAFGPRTVVRHSVPKMPTPKQFESTVFFRCIECQVIMETSDELCNPCSKASKQLKKTTKKRTKASPAKSKAPLAACGPEKLWATVKATRLECKMLKEQLQEMQERIQEQGICIDKSLEEDIRKIMDGQNMNATPHMKFFWEEQMKLLQSASCGRRYHPQIIRFALSLHGKSPSAYRELRKSGALVLPSERILRDYKNYFPPKAGINNENVNALRKKAASFTGNQRYVVLVMDEMKIQSDLVFDKNSGDLVGFMDLGDPMTNFACLDEKDTIATHAFAFLVRGLCTDVKHIIAYFFTGNVTSYQLMPIFWKVVSTLELSLDLWVVGLVNDGASPNRKLFNLHVKLAVDQKCDVVYKTINLFAPSRFIFFFADIPHLMKTARNCLYNSGSGSRSRLMWNDGQYLLFKHIADIFYRDQAVALHVLPKLTLEHIVLTSFSKMKVKLATQVLSRSVALALEESGNSEVLGTAEFCRMMNDFFDCTNVRSLREHERKRNDLIKPYTAVDDDRFGWLRDVFLKYLENWKRSTRERAGQYSADDRGKMFLSSQTHEGLQIAVHSHVEAIQFLLQQGFQYVLSERFMQDVLEDYFGHQRAKGGRADNPSAYEFGYNDLKIAAQRDIAPVVRGNVGGRYEKKKWYTVSDEPVEKRKKKK